MKSIAVSQCENILITWRLQEDKITGYLRHTGLSLELLNNTFSCPHYAIIFPGDHDAQAFVPSQTHFNVNTYEQFCSKTFCADRRSLEDCNHHKCKIHGIDLKLKKNCFRTTHQTWSWYPDRFSPARLPFLQNFAGSFPCTFVLPAVQRIPNNFVQQHLQP